MFPEKVLMRNGEERPLFGVCEGRGWQIPAQQHCTGKGCKARHQTCLLKMMTIFGSDVWATKLHSSSRVCWNFVAAVEEHSAVAVTSRLV